jgi:hypothetical protein
MSAQRRTGRQLARTSPRLLQEIRGRAAAEVVHALVAGADMRTVRPLITLVAECDRRLERRTAAAVDADRVTTTLERRTAVAATRDPEKRSGG